MFVEQNVLVSVEYSITINVHISKERFISFPKSPTTMLEAIFAE